MPVKKTARKTTKKSTAKKKPITKKTSPKKTAKKKSVIVKRKEGRPEKYIQSVHPQFAAALASIGLTDKEIAVKMGIARSTLSLWKDKHPEFSDAMAQGKIEPNEKVKRSLYERAVGYYFRSVKIMQYKGKPVTVPYIEHCPPEPSAIRLWLINRMPEEWRDKPEVKVNLNYTITPPPTEFPEDSEEQDPQESQDGAAGEKPKSANDA